MPAHVFIDNSNIIGGARRTAAILEPSAPIQSIRIYYANFCRLIEGAHEIRTRVMAGSVPPGNDALWEYARSHGYQTDLLRRVEKEDGRLTEQGVDELIHLKIANLLLDMPDPASQTLILATGDGGVSDYQTSFLDQVKRALKLDWNVEIWSWRSQLSGKFSKLHRPNKVGQLKIYELDPDYKEITFAKEGDYRVNGQLVTFEGRIVQRY